MFVKNLTLPLLDMLLRSKQELWREGLDRYLKEQALSLPYPSSTQYNPTSRGFGQKPFSLDPLGLGLHRTKWVGAATTSRAALPWGTKAIFPPSLTSPDPTLNATQLELFRLLRAKGEVLKGVSYHLSQGEPLFSVILLHILTVR